MFETMIVNKNFVEVNSENNVMISIQDVWKVEIMKTSRDKYYVHFETQFGGFTQSDNFETEQEAIEFRDKILKGENIWYLLKVI